MTMNRLQDTHSLSLSVSGSCHCDCRRSAAACVRVLRICTTHRLVHRRSNCLLNRLAYFVFQTLSVAADRIWRIRLGKRAAVQRTTASAADAMGPLFTTFCACAHNCIYIPRMREVESRRELFSVCVFRTIYFISASIIVYVPRTVK